MTQTTTLMPEGRQRYFNNDGTPCAGGKLTTYAAGTTTPKATYSDADGNTPNPNPITLDAHGEAVIYWAGAYKVDIRQADGQQVTGYPVDNMRTDPAGVWGLVGSLVTSVGAGLIGFIQSGVGAIVRTILDKLREAPTYEDFGADGTGAADSAPAFVRAHTARRTVKGVPGSTYTLATTANFALEEDTVLCLISGGGSSLLALPLDGITLADKQALNRGCWHRVSRCLFCR